MREYLDAIRQVRFFGNKRPDRTGIGTTSVFGCQVKFDLTTGFPAVTTKKLAFEQVKGELLCFIHGKHNLSDFHKHGVTIWDANGTAPYWQPKETGDLGRIYGVQWRDWQGANKVVDQLQELIAGLKADPYGRRHIVTAWQPAELDQMCLPPCHILFQCYVQEDYLDMRVDMRSLDMFLGFPFDIASYGLLLSIIAREVSLIPRNLIFHIGDAHIYNNHKEQVEELLKRNPTKKPQLVLHIKSMFELEMSDIALIGYNPQPTIKAVMAV